MTNNRSAVFEIAMMARVTWDLHSLNNEGTVGNVTEPRTVVLASGEKSDGVSGEMLKHIHSYNVWLLEADKSRFCPACQRLQPQKADEPAYRKTIAGKTNAEVMAKAIAKCALCDLHGFLVEKPPIARRSTVEFGWAVGLPQQYHREIHLHARHSMEERQTRDRREAAQHEQQERGEEREVSAQMVYHRPTRSGVYALVSLFQPWRIGLNEITYDYVPDADRQARYRLALLAYKAALTHTDGAMTSTRLPHPEALEGVIALSTRNFPAPVVSPLNDTYDQEVAALAKQESGCEVYTFNSLLEVSKILDDLSQRPILSFKT
ncbi:MAG: DevR family CRISPR-associated autoregulator [Chloroflexi bacterium]|nr:MAG: DevR family CRISPR-associated autoregulator [Chloroflexota bacterium]